MQACVLVGKKGRVVAFEPNPHAATLLRRNVHLNRFDDIVDIQSVAIGEQAGQIDFFVDGANPMARAGVPNPLVPKAGAITVLVITLDEFLVQCQRQPRCVIMDIEGWEIGALKGAHRFLTSVSREIVLIVEIHPSAWPWSAHNRSELEAVLEKYDLEPVPLSGQRDPLAEHGHVWLRFRTGTTGQKFA